MKLAHSIAGKSRNLTFEQSKRFLERIKETAFSDEEIFISAEPFYRHTIGETSKYCYMEKQGKIRSTSKKFLRKLM